jgi:hypothetical protein
MLSERLERFVGVVEALLEARDRLLDLAARRLRRARGTGASASARSRRRPA